LLPSTERKVVQTYSKLLLSTGHGPPPNAVADGTVALDEALPWLAERHRWASTTAVNNTPGALKLVKRRELEPLFDNLIQVMGDLYKSLIDVQPF